MRTLTIAFKDLLQIVRDWKSALFLVIMPILFTAFFAFVLDPVYRRDAEQDPRLPVGWHAADGDSASAGGSASAGLQLAAALRTLAEDSPAIRLETVDAEALAEAEQRVARGELAGLVLVPEGYAADLLAGRAVRPTIVAGAVTAAGNTTIRAIETAAARLTGALRAARISVDLYRERYSFASSRDEGEYLAQALAQALAAWEDPALTAELRPFTASEEPQVMSGLVQASSGMMIQFAIFGLITAAMVLVLERRSGALQRLRAAPVGPAGIIAGHVLALFLVILVQQFILIAVGQFVFGVQYLRAPGAVLVMAVVLALWAASLGLLISAVSRREEQVVVFSLVCMFVFSALGGAWFPLAIAGGTFEAIGRVMPTAWAIEGFQNVVLRGLGMRSILAPAGIVLAYAGAFFALAVWRFRYEQAP
jgi:ABC-2 type transport system permease protein